MKHSKEVICLHDYFQSLNTLFSLTEFGSQPRPFFVETREIQIIVI